jgi:hypothetical protein
MLTASIIVPSYNVAATLRETLTALLAQTFSDYEVVIVDDGSTDETALIAESFTSDPRVRLVQQRNRGLAGARNTGIADSSGVFIGFCDADDIWEPTKLATHVAHLQQRSDIGVSYSGSALIDEAGKLTGMAQQPRLKGVTASHIFKRNPIGNGSAPVIRRAVFDAIAYRPSQETERDWYFDETFRQSEDIECWLRIALTTDWMFEGLEGQLTQYRIASGGLSAATDRQLAAWERMVTKLSAISPQFFAQHVSAARSYQLRYLCRRAVSDLDAPRAMAFGKLALKTSIRPAFEEPIKSLVTLVATVVLQIAGKQTMQILMMLKSARA